MGVHELPAVVPAAKYVLGIVVLLVPASSRMPVHASTIVLPVTVLPLPLVPLSNTPQLASK
jgi:hypothetical protein